MIDNLSGQEIKDQFKSNKTLKIVTYLVGGLAVLALGYFVYKQFIWNPANEKSMETNYVALNYVSMDSTDMAIDELNAHVKKYDGKTGGEVSQFVLGRQLMEKGEFKKAIDELESVDLNDTYVKAMAIGLQGDCYSELKNYAKAQDLYAKAAETNPNEMTSPMYLFKAGLCAEQNKKYSEAADFYKKIRDNYLNFSQQKRIEKYIARTENRK